MKKIIFVAGMLFVLALPLSILAQEELPEPTLETEVTPGDPVIEDNPSQTPTNTDQKTQEGFVNGAIAGAIGGLVVGGIFTWFLKDKII